MKACIIGAGPAGLACAAALLSRGVEVEIFESDNAVGGMTKSIELWGQRVDLGPHRFFCADQKVNRFWTHFTGKEYVMVDRQTRIYYKQKFFDYPVKAMNALSNLGFISAAECVLSYIYAQLFQHGKEANFEEWVSRRFGYKLYSIFFKTYSERLWGIPCTELDADFARQRIKKLDMLEVIKNAFFGGGAKKHKTLLDRFAYPKNGAGETYEKMAEYIREKGGKIEFDTPVKSILTEDHVAYAIELEDGRVCEADQIISTAPFTDMLGSIQDMGDDVKKLAGELRYRNTTIVYLLVDGKGLFSDNWLYIHDPEVQVGRITNFRNWSPYMTKGSEKTILALEYWSYDNDELWKMDDGALISLAKADMIKTGLLKGKKIEDGHVVRIHRSYPVYDTGYAEKVQKLQKAADSLDHVCFIGRNGSFKYNNQDHSLLMGMLAAKNILAGTKKYDLWTVNTDKEYQEAGKQKMG